MKNHSKKCSNAQNNNAAMTLSDNQKLLSPSRGRGQVRGCGFERLHPHPDPLPQGRGSYQTGSNSRFDHLNLDHWILPFDMAQGGKSLDPARDPEPVEGLVEPFRIFNFSAVCGEVAGEQGKNNSASTPMSSLERDERLFRSL